MTLKVRTLLALAFVAGSADFALAQGTLPRPVIRDSAGIRIIEYPSLGPEAPQAAVRNGRRVESTLRALPQAFRIESKPYIDIGGTRDNEQEELDAKHSMSMAVELSNGTIVVNDRVQLKYFTNRGALIRVVGRAGNGPGEFGQTREVCRLRGDSLLAIEYSNGRLSLWDANGTHLRTYPRPGNVLFGSCQADGSVILTGATSGVTGFDDAGDRLVSYQVVRPDGALVRDLGRLPAPEYVGSYARVPTVRVIGDQLLVAAGRTWDVRLQGFDGRVRRITRLGGPPISITDKEWQQATKGTIPRGSSPENTNRIKAMMARKPDSYPALARILVDPAGRLWVQDDLNARSFSVLDTSGVLLGRFHVPGAGMDSDKELIGIGADHVVIRDRDGDGAVHLQFFRITPIANTTQ